MPWDGDPGQARLLVGRMRDTSASTPGEWAQRPPRLLEYQNVFEVDADPPRARRQRPIPAEEPMRRQGIPRFQDAFMDDLRNITRVVVSHPPNTECKIVGMTSRPAELLVVSPAKKRADRVPHEPLLLVRQEIVVAFEILPRTK